MTDYDYTWRIMMFGEASTDKTALLIQNTSGFFEDLKLTIGVNFYSKTTIYRDKKVKLQIWDFEVEDRFRFFLPQYCKGKEGAMILYDITNRLTLDYIPDWIQLIRENAGDIPIMLIGAKLDLAPYRVITREEGINAVKKYNLSSYIEISAKTSQNVETAFNMMTEILFDKYKKQHI